MGLRRRTLLAAGLAALGPAGCSRGQPGRAPDRKVEVFSWWAGPGEKEGLEALVADFRTHNPGIDFDNAAVAGGAGTVARTVLATRPENTDPPDSYQTHAGREQTADIKAGYLQDLGELSREQGWASAVAEWADPGTRVVGSLTHGVVAGPSWNAAIDTAPAAFVLDGDAARFAAAVAAGRP